jgi:Zn-dependent peptidase ImmA (M78 family)
MALNPEILRWARTTAGLSVEEAARALGFNDTQTRSATDRLTAFETGEEEPSRSVLLRMAKAYRRSLLVFYLQEPPPTGDRGKDFRTVPGAPPPLYNPLLDTLIRDLRGRQGIVRSLVEEDEPPVTFVGSATMSRPVEELAREITARLDFSLSDFRRQPNVETSFGYLRAKIEAAGIYVLLLGNLGSHHTNITVETFRGFAIADPVAPFIVVNDQDTRAAWAFTALHEVAHLWLGATGVSGANIDAQIEKYCNDVAGEILLPAAEIKKRLAGLRNMPFASALEDIGSFAGAAKLSRSMVAYQLFKSQIIGEATWRRLTEQFRQDWLASRAREEAAERKSSGGPSYYVVKRHRLGNALLSCGALLATARLRTRRPARS